MLKRKRLKVKLKIVISYLPFLGKIKELPFSSAGSAPVVMTVLLFPAGVISFCIPYDLGIGSYKYIVSPSFKLLAF